jgi:hypothetical protein
LDRRTIGLVWLGGVVLMAVLYVIGPQHFIQACEDAITRVLWFLDDIVETMMSRAFDAVRAAAIALYVVFLVLAMLASRRGLRVGGAVVVVSLLFLVLVRTNWYDPATKWLSAAVVAAVAAGVMTSRLLRSSSGGRDPARPWGDAAHHVADRFDSRPGQ